MTMTKTWDAGVTGLAMALGEAFAVGLDLAGVCATAFGPQAASRQIDMTRAANLIDSSRYERNLKSC
jgi:hypothetical protein